MYKIAHISDVHLGPMDNIHWTSLLSKRITGYINWQRNRAKKFSPAILSGLLQHLLQAGPDHIAITGDLVNLSLPFEIERAKKWLEQLGTGENISIVCGNHDAYVKGMLEEAVLSWQDYLIADDRKPVRDNTSFPLLRRRGPCSLILVNSAIPTRPFNASGLFDLHQAEKLEQLLLQEKNRCRIILIHHPPFPDATTTSKKLHGDDLFRQVIRNAGADLVLHGHTHLDTHTMIDGPDHDVSVLCVAAGGQGIGGRKPPAQYNWFEIAHDSSGWQINHTRYGYRDNDMEIIRLTEPRLL